MEFEVAVSTQSEAFHEEWAAVGMLTHGIPENGSCNFCVSVAAGARSSSGGVRGGKTLDTCISCTRRWARSLIWQNECPVMDTLIETRKAFGQFVSFDNQQTLLCPQGRNGTREPFVVTPMRSRLQASRKHRQISSLRWLCSALKPMNAAYFQLGEYGSKQASKWGIEPQWTCLLDSCLRKPCLADKGPWVGGRIQCCHFHTQV